MKKVLLTLVVAIMATSQLFAVEALVNGINYNFIKLAKTAEVIALSSGKYTGSVVIPATVVYDGTTYNVTSIGGSAFYYCTGLTSVVIPNSVTSIGNNAFYGCSGLTSIIIPNSVTSIGDHAFYHCSHLTSITIPESVTSIDSYAFDGCSGLTSVTIPNSVTSIGSYVFSGCSGLTSVTIPNSVTSIEKWAFSSCSGLTSVTIPNSVTNIGDYAFYHCTGLTAVHISDLEVWCGLTFYSYANPLEYAHHLYLNGTEVTDLVIPNSITSINIQAFIGCSGLTSVTIPNSVTSIGNNAFSGCSGLTSVNIGDGVTSIGYSAFYGCSGLTSITIPNSVTEIDGSVFSGCTNLTSVTIGRSVENIGSYHGQNYTFKDCESLELITCLAANPPSYGSETFWILPQYTLLQVPCGSEEDYRTAWGFSNIQTIDSTCPSFFPENQKIYYTTTDGNKVNITRHAANIVSNTYVDGQGCIVFDSDLTSIASYAFASCSTLVSISIPSSVTYIGSDAFKGCSNLESVHISDIAAWCGIQFGNYSANPVCYTHHLYLNGTEVTDLIIPDTVTSIGDYAFDYCSGLTSVTIPNSVTSIGSYAFDYCSGLTSVTIGNSVTSIGNNAFSDCFGLTSITCEAATPPTCERSNWLFYGVSTSIPVYVPCDAVSAYQAAEGWSRFTNIQPIAGSSCEKPCGDSLYWSVANDTLFITGSGAMYDYNDTDNKAPWYSIPFTQVVLPEGMTNISDYAFKGCSGLTSITIPNSVTSIGTLAFSGCSNLASVTLPNSLTYIPYGLFWGCRLSSVAIPNSVTKIENNAFHSCSALTSVTIPSSVTRLGSYVFEDCTALSSIVVEAGNTEYDSRDNCNAIIETAGNALRVGCKNTVIPETVTQIYSGAFSGCSGLTSITIPASMLYIYPKAFYKCSNLASITCKATTPPTAYSEIFYGVSTSIPVYVPCDAVSAYQAAEEWNRFTNIQPIEGTCPPMCGDNLYWSFADGELTIRGMGAMYDYDTNPTPWDTLSITSVSFLDGMTSIGKYAFLECTGLTSVTIPNSVTSIGDGAFYGCSKLTSVTIPNSVTSIGDGAFYGCSKLTSVTIPNSVTSIERYAFYNCNSLASVSIQEGVTSISYGAFGYCRALKQLTIPNSVINIGDYAFVGCWNLKSLTIPENVTSIGECAFSGCSDLTSITCEATTPPTCGNYCFSSVPTSIPVYVPCESVEAYQAASGWSTFTNIQAIPGSSCERRCGDNLYWSYEDGALTITGTGAMYDYQGFTNPSPWYGSTISTLSLPDGLTHIGDYAFLDCSSLTAVSIPNSVTSLGEYAFGYCTNLQSIVIPTSITSLGNRVFSGCSGLTSVTLPNSLTSIGDGTFAGCQALTSISIPGGVTSIGAYAFTACFGLSSITCKAMIPPTCGTDCFASVSKSIPVYVPCISVSAYQTAEGWSDFTNIQPIEGSCEAEEITDLVEEVVVEPAANTVTITWSNVSSANTYILEITKEGELICRLTFNSMGQIIDIAFAPSRNGVLPARAAQEVIGGWQFTITGLESGTHYDYALTIMNGQQPIATHTGSFITDTTNYLESQSESSTMPTMFLRDGQILIQRGNTTYNLRGQVVK